MMSNNSKWVFPKIWVSIPPRMDGVVSWKPLLKWMIWGVKNPIFGLTPKCWNDSSCDDGLRADVPPTPPSNTGTRMQSQTMAEPPRFRQVETTNLPTLKLTLSPRKVVFQPSIFRAELLVSGRVLAFVTDFG